MRVAVIGSGGIGGLYGGLLARAGHEVAFLARGKHLDAIRQKGLEIRSADFGTFTVQGPASDDAREFGEVDLVLFAVKTYDLPDAAQQAKHVLAPQASLLTFQNGLDAPDELATIVGAEHVLIGTTRLETTIIEPGVIGHLTPGHLVTVSAFSGPPTPRTELIAETFRAAGVRTNVEPDGHRALWEKASQLIPMATITAVCRAPIGPIRDLRETRELAEMLLEEFSRVARAYGYDLSESQSRPGLNLRSAPATMKASMARDFERGNRTELEALSGALVRLADARGVDVPASRSAYAILKLRERLEAGAETPLGMTAGGR
jgi:2-dehydropantoate 2-reductase